MTDKANDGGPNEHKAKWNIAATPEEPADVEGHKNVSKDAGPEGSAPKPKFDSGEDEDVEGHAGSKSKDGAPEGAGSRKMPTFDGEDDDVEGHASKKLSL